MSKLFVGNLSYQLSEEELKKTFEAYGNIKEVRLLQNKGFGFVEFESDESAQKAMEELNGKELRGRKIRVEMARPRQSNPRNHRTSRNMKDQREQSYRNSNYRNSRGHRGQSQRRFSSQDDR
ncbi:MAG: RNA-binding protein [bacterium]